jgi:hypothetical protein
VRRAPAATADPNAPPLAYDPRPQAGKPAFEASRVSHFLCATVHFSLVRPTRQLTGAAIAFLLANLLAAALVSHARLGDVSEIPMNELRIRVAPFCAGSATMLLARRTGVVSKG